MRSNFLKELVLDLISKKKEGEWWDFKEDFTDNVTLVHDIICMANQTIRHDSYIIYGIEDKTFNIVGVENSEVRKNQQNVIDLIRQVKFAGDNRPDIYLDTISIEGHEIDVISIPNSNRTPFYLYQDYRHNDKRIRTGCIYSRNGDTNTPKDSTSDYHVVEMLWRKRFGLDLNIREKLDIVLDDYRNWYFDWGNKRYAYNYAYPEFQMVYDGDFVEGWEPLAAFYLAPDFKFVKLNLVVFNTIIYETELWALDGGRKYLPKPTISSIVLSRENETNFYFYYLLDTPEGKICKILTNGTFELYSRERSFNQILIFKDNKEKERFDAFYQDHYRYIDMGFIKKRYFCIIQNEDKTGMKRNFSSIHIAIAAELYMQWKKK